MHPCTSRVNKEVCRQFLLLSSGSLQVASVHVAARCVRALLVLRASVACATKGRCGHLDDVGSRIFTIDVSAGVEAPRPRGASSAAHGFMDQRGRVDRQGGAVVSSIFGNYAPGSRAAP